jgi:hypothetical protein
MMLLEACDPPPLASTREDSPGGDSGLKLRLELGEARRVVRSKILGSPVSIRLKSKLVSVVMISSLDVRDGETGR